MQAEHTVRDAVSAHGILLTCIDLVVFQKVAAEEITAAATAGGEEFEVIIGQLRQFFLIDELHDFIHILTVSELSFWSSLSWAKSLSMDP